MTIRYAEISDADVRRMGYVDFVAFLGETNRPPGGKNAVRILLQNAFVTKDSKVLDVGCNTGYCSFEMAHLANCHVTGIDINPRMIETANTFRARETPFYQERLVFETVDGMRMPYADNSFDLVMSGGSTAFIAQKTAALQEYKRVCRDWGFVGDINFFYHTLPPARLIQELNDMMSTDIQPWGLSYWTELYAAVGLEQFYIHEGMMREVSDAELDAYCRYMAARRQFSAEVERAVFEKWRQIMVLFNENHRYLAYGVFVYRKRPYEEERTLFGL
ncbi:MAG: methyltransferase domain-containing protein [Anaerolineales bacterium]|nr:methyltransferase domain-containing protein [Anaerolineales bacterium]MCB8954673.1 methyltransferase domain-containing protein [Ardenticatenales bacterium]